jgi:hypothetical protein
MTEPVMKDCQGCNESLPTECFPTRNDRSGRLRPYCYTCAADAKRKRYKHHKETSPFKLRCSKIKARAVAIGVPFNLTPEYLELIWEGKCPISGVPMVLDGSRDAEDAPELDRMIADKGYVEGNVAFISRKFNRIKNSASISDIELLLTWMRGGT